MLRITREGDPAFDRAYFRKLPNPFAKFVSGKRVAIVGGSPQIIGTGQGEYIDSHDTVIRINCHWPCPRRLVPKIEAQSDLGWRTDILIHNGGCGGPLEDVQKMQGLRNIIFTGNGNRVVGEFTPYAHVRPMILEWAYHNGIQTHWYDHYWHGLRVRSSTAGFNTILAVLQENIKELFITGFGFYTQKSESQFIASTLHMPNLEQKYFRDHIMLDERVKLSEHTRRSCEGNHPCEDEQQQNAG